MKRNIKVFNYSFILRTIGLGMFNTLFNIYILENSNFSNAFLEKFLAIGNFSMAVSSYFIGFTIDRYNKKKLMLFFSSICAICIFGEVVISNEIVMYVVSVIYGIGAAGLITIVPPILMTYKTEENRNFHKHNSGNRGSGNGRAKLTEQDVYNIRLRLRRKNGETLSEVYEDYKDLLTKGSFINV